MDTTSNTLEIDSILLDFKDRRILSDIYLKCQTDKITTLIGRNGSGKSCLLKIITGQLKPISKSVRINNQSIQANYPNINYLPQFHFVPGFLKIKSVMADYDVNEAEFIHFFPEFKAKINSPFSRLSGGERRLIEVYILIKSPVKFTLLDEPFTQIMPLHLEKIKSIIRSTLNKGFLITDHLYRDAMSISDSAYLLQNGKTWPVTCLEDLQKRGYISHL